MYKSDIYTLLLRTVDENTGIIKAYIVGSGTQSELQECVQFWKLRCRFVRLERAFLTFSDFSEYVRQLLLERTIDYEEVEKYAVAV